RIFGGLRAGDVERAREAEIGLAVREAVVDRLGDAALLGRDFLARHAEYFGGGLRVDVDAIAERRRQQRIARQVREDAQLDLRVVGRDQNVARRRDKAATDLHAEVAADRNVLEIGILGRDAPGLGDNLVERRVHAAGLGGHERRQRIEVRALEL